MYIEMAVVSEHDVDLATVSIRDLAGTFGFDALEANLIAAASSELSMNMVRHANGGLFRVRMTDNGRGLEACFFDQGPGIPDLKCAFKEGYSTLPDSLGLGLGAAQRAVEFLDVSSTEGVGTAVTFRHFLPPPADQFELGIVSMRDVDYDCNGDLVVERLNCGDTQLLAVIDGMGQGIPARQAAIIARDVIATTHLTNPVELTAQAHQAVLDAGLDYGFVMAMVVADEHQFRFVTVGDVDCRIYSVGQQPGRHQVPERPGLLGTRQPVSFSEYPVNRNHVNGPVAIILASDGVSPRYDIDSIPTDFSAQDIAEEIFQGHRRRHGDATVAVLKVAA